MLYLLFLYSVDDELSRPCSVFTDFSFDSFSFSHASNIYIGQAVLSNMSGSSGYGGVSLKFCRVLLSVVSNLLAAIFNFCLYTSVFPGVFYG